VVVCAGQNSAKYQPWLMFWVIVTTLIGVVFAIQTVREHRSRN
jgi:hypothetical protein